MKIWVVMGNDFPDAVFDTEAGAKQYCKDKRDANKAHREKMPGPTIYWRSYEFDLRQ